jgi:hypothetical protein
MAKWFELKKFKKSVRRFFSELISGGRAQPPPQPAPQSPPQSQPPSPAPAAPYAAALQSVPAQPDATALPKRIASPVPFGSLTDENGVPLLGAGESVRSRLDAPGSASASPAAESGSTTPKLDSATARPVTPAGSADHSSDNARFRHTIPAMCPNGRPSAGTC